MNKVLNRENLSLYSFKESLKCDKLNKISALKKEKNAFIEYMNCCKEALFYGLEGGNSPFIEPDEKMYDLFALMNAEALEEERKQLFRYDMRLWNRLYQYLISNEYKFVTDYVYTTNIANVCVSSKCYILKRNGKLILCKVKAGKSKLAYKARKFENMMCNDLDLMTMIGEAQQIFPEQDVECGLFYLKGKNETLKDFAEYEVKKGENIYSMVSNAADTRTVTYEYLTQVADGYIEHRNTEKKCDECKNKFFCDLKNHKIEKPQSKKEDVAAESITTSIKNEQEVILSEAQESIVSKRLGNFLVSAVPGAGKTRILVERVKRLLSSEIAPGRIMLITFTNEAMKEIRRRLVFVNGGSQVHVTTFNKFGHSILTENYVALGYELPPTIATKYESYLYLVEAIKELKIETNLMYAFKDYGLLKKLYPVVISNSVIPEDSKLPEEIIEKIVEIRELFFKKLYQESLITYDMQITEAIKLLKSNEILRLSYEVKHDFIMVDEYQDSDDKNAELVNLVADNNIMVVGDEDQSIYGFKGANINNFLNFYGEKYFMIENYRSSDSVIALSNALISKNLQRIDSRKRIIPKLDMQGEVRFMPGERCVDKLPYIVNELVAEGYDLNDIAVIARTHSLLDGASQALKEKAIETVYGAKNLVESFEFEILYHFLNAYINFDRESMMIVCSYLYNLDENADVNTPYEEMFKDISKDVEVEEFAAAFDNITAVLGNKEHLIYSKLKDNCVTYGIYTLSKLYSYMFGLKITEDNISIPVTNDNGVVLLTAHAAKGSEYKAVIILNTEKFKAKTAAEEEEERRLLYVTLTRAKEKLFITYSKVDGFLNELGVEEL